VTAPRIEVTRSGPAKPWLGQLVPINVDVWRPKGDAPLEPFSLDDVVAAGMIVKWSDQAPPPDEKQEGETRFLVQHRTLLAFPQSDGQLTLPPIVARWTDPVTQTPVFAHSSELSFQAALPPTVGAELPLVAGSVSLRQTFDRDLSKLRVGDGFTRTLTLHATDTDPIVFPQLSLADAPGLTGYRTGSQASTNTERGQFQADLPLRTTYVVDRVGPHRMSGVTLRWLEPRSGRYLDASVPELTFWSGPNPALGFQCLGTASSASFAPELGSLSLLALLGFAIVRRLRRGPGRLELTLKERSRERSAFREATHAIRQDPALFGLQKIYAWLAVRFPASSDRTLSPLKGATKQAGDACLALERAVFRERNMTTPGRSFVTMLRRTRRAMGRAQRAVALERLNPARNNEGGR
jgi:hypothetical protein